MTTADYELWQTHALATADYEHGQRLAAAAPLARDGLEPGLMNGARGVVVAILYAD